LVGLRRGGAVCLRLPGGFVFDDIPNLTGLESIRTRARPRNLSYRRAGGELSCAGLARTCLRPAARELADDPQAFKDRKHLLHLLNGALSCGHGRVLVAAWARRTPQGIALAAAVSGSSIRSRFYRVVRRAKAQ